MELGFHIFVYDHRNHHLSDKKITTMGDKEADDLQLVINYVKEKFNYDVVIGTHGESMGAATVMIHAGRYHSVSFVIEDCGFDDLYDLLYYLQKYNLNKVPGLLMFFANIVFKIKTGKEGNK